MWGFIKRIEPIEFIGDNGGQPAPPIGYAAWDDNTPWDSGVYWRGAAPEGKSTWDVETPWDVTTFWS